MAASPKTRVLREVEMLARIHTPRAIEILAALMVSAESENVRRMCANDLLDRGWGKSRTTISVDDPSSLSDEQLDRALQERLALALAGTAGGRSAGSGDRAAALRAEEATGPWKPPGVVH